MIPGKAGLIQFSMATTVQCKRASEVTAVSVCQNVHSAYSESLPTNHAMHDRFQRFHLPGVTHILQHLQKLPFAANKQKNYYGFIYNSFVIKLYFNCIVDMTCLWNISYLQTVNLDGKCSFLPLTVSAVVACHVVLVRTPNSLSHQSPCYTAVIMQFIAQSLSTCFCSNHQQTTKQSLQAFVYAATPLVFACSSQQMPEMICSCGRNCCETFCDVKLDGFKNL